MKKINCVLCTKKIFIGNNFKTHESLILRPIMIRDLKLISPVVVLYGQVFLRYRDDFKYNSCHETEMFISRAFIWTRACSFDLTVTRKNLSLKVTC